MLLTDTVGFIQKLPTQIVAAFRATLEEIGDADVLLHVVDATHPQAAAQIESVEDTLAELDLDHIPTVIALNKVDQLPAGTDPKAGLSLRHLAAPVSAVTGQGLAELVLLLEAEIVRPARRADRRGRRRRPLRRAARRVGLDPPRAAGSTGPSSRTPARRRRGRSSR